MKNLVLEASNTSPAIGFQAVANGFGTQTYPTQEKRSNRSGKKQVQIEFCKQTKADAVDE